MFDFTAARDLIRVPLPRFLGQNPSDTRLSVVFGNFLNSEIQHLGISRVENPRCLDQVTGNDGHYVLLPPANSGRRQSATLASAPKACLVLVSVSPNERYSPFVLLLAIP